MSNDNMNKDNMNKASNADQAVLPAGTATDEGHAVLPAGSKTGEGNQSGVASKIQAVKSAWDKSPEGQKKANALKHYQSAEKAQHAGKDAEALEHYRNAERYCPEYLDVKARIERLRAKTSGG